MTPRSPRPSSASLDPAQIGPRISIREGDSGSHESERWKAGWHDLATGSARRRGPAMTDCVPPAPGTGSLHTFPRPVGAPGPPTPDLSGRRIP
jgi:hypothetical protein